MRANLQYSLTNQRLQRPELEQQESKNKPKVDIPELKLISINDYMTNKGRPVPAIPFAINDLLG